MEFYEALTVVAKKTVWLYAILVTALLVGVASRANFTPPSAPAPALKFDPPKVKPFVVVCPYCNNRLSVDPQPVGSTGAVLGAVIKK